MEKPDVKWVDARIEVSTVGPDELGFYTATLSYKNSFYTHGQARSASRACAYALRELAESIICASISQDGWMGDGNGEA